MPTISATTTLRDGINAAKAGDKETARRLIREVLAREPHHEAAWLWLAGVAETPKEAVEALKKALAVNPSNDKAREGLNAALLQAGIAEMKSGNKSQARSYFAEVVEHDSRNELAWLWMAGIAESPHDMLAHLDRVLAINPANDRARAGHKSARLQVAIANAKAGKKDAARPVLRETVESDPANETAWQWLATVAETPAESLRAWKKILELNPRHERAPEAIRYYEAQLTPPKPGASSKSEVRVTPNIPVKRESPSKPELDSEAVIASKPEVQEPQEWVCPMCAEVFSEPMEPCGRCGVRLDLKDLDAFFQDSDVHVPILKKAVSHYEAQCRQQPEFASYFYLGLAYLNLKDLAQAVTQLGHAARLKPRDRVLRMQLGALTHRLTARQAPASETPNAAPKNKGMILVVDDSPTVRKMVSMTMEKNGFAVVTASDGYGAANALHKIYPDLILLDIAMPGIDGYQVCKLVKENKETAHIPVVMLSGKDGFFDKIRGRMAGSTAYITKPFKADDLVDVVQQFCRPKTRV